MMPSTTLGGKKQRKMKLPTETTDVPPLHKKKGCEGPVWVPLRVCGFLISFDSLVAYAERNVPDNFEVDPRRREDSEAEIREYRRQNALRDIRKLLDIHNYVLVRLADGRIHECVLVGSNYDEEELAHACDPIVIDKFRKVLGLEDTCMPKWYRYHEP